MAEYDGKVTWEAYAAQFEILAAVQGWSKAEKAIQFWGTCPQPTSYESVTEALWHRFGHYHQAEVYCVHLKKRTQERGKTLSQLAQDMEALVRSISHSRGRNYHGGGQ